MSKAVNVSRLSNEEIAELMYELAEEVEARLKYGRRAATEDASEGDNAALPF